MTVWLPTGFEAHYAPYLSVLYFVPLIQAVTFWHRGLYRVRGGAVDFKTLGLAPRTFLGQPGYQFDFEHLDGDEVWRKGRAVGTTVNGRLYLTLYDAVRSHYYNAAIADYEAITESARLKR